MQFPHVSVLARQVLGIMGSKIQIEKIFNFVGIVTNLWRSRIGINNLNCFVLVIKHWPNNACIRCDGEEAKNLHDYLQAEKIIEKNHELIDFK
jgi:hypothetical protein